MNRQKLTKDVLYEIFRIKLVTDIDILKMPDKEMEKCVEYLVRRFWE